ncbi:hypothetical protein ACNQGB_09070 [Flavobacterium sp. XS1P32]|uniref:hypothetical protein n=1 Tax=Flavobacterium sp. XS1P32 TaxID=3401726 RepID=UPI003AAC4B9D
MLDKKTINLLKETIEKLDKSENIGGEITAGRTAPTPQFSLKPKDVAKPKDEK